MFVDAGTKLMDTTTLKRTLLSGEWSVEYNPAFVKQTAKTKEAYGLVTSLPGREPGATDQGLMEYVKIYSQDPGWHFANGVGVHVAANAKGYRSPAPRFAVKDFPLRTSVAEFKTPNGASWRILEDMVNMADLPNPQEQFVDRSMRLVSFFHPVPKPQKYQGM